MESLSKKEIINLLRKWRADAKDAPANSNWNDYKTGYTDALGEVLEYLGDIDVQFI